MKENVRRVNPPAQLEAYMTAQREQAEDEEDFLTPAELVDMLRHPEVYGHGCDDEDGWGHPDDTHADPSRYTDAELLAMDDAMTAGCLTICTLHVDHRYPVVPSGIWEPQVGAALDRLAELTEAHGGQADGPYLATPDELRQLWDELPHARWWIEEQGDRGALDIDMKAA